ncbi:hypothetical protein B0H14DRAFT_2801007 [Mycena olivaceomarginata]|nr:hypothetical protein B0H14DRAFT_2801007 [Mycena olivaceomarginata]
MCHARGLDGRNWERRGGRDGDGRAREQLRDADVWLAHRPYLPGGGARGLAGAMTVIVSAELTPGVTPLTAPNLSFHRVTSSSASGPEGIDKLDRESSLRLVFRALAHMLLRHKLKLLLLWLLCYGIFEQKPAAPHIRVSDPCVEQHNPTSD